MENGMLLSYAVGRWGAEGNRRGTRGAGQGGVYQEETNRRKVGGYG